MNDTRRQRCAAAERRARDQDGILSRHQLRGLELTRHDVRTEVRARRWQAPSPHTIAIQTGPLNQRQLWWVAILETGCAEAALDGLSALQAAGLTGLDGPLTVSCPHGSRPRATPGVDVRETRWRRDGDVVTAGLPRLRVSAAAVHAALWARSDRAAALFLVASVQQRLTTPDRLTTELALVRRHRRRSVVTRVLADLADGAQALGELDFVGLCRSHGLPCPTRQAVRLSPGGRWYLDSSFDQYGVVVEIDGVAHLEGLNPVADALRQNALVIGGELVLRIPLLGLRVAPGEFVDQLAACLRSRGWSRAA